MEENNRPANNEDRNIFYEYFSNLERKENYKTVPTTEEINKVFADFQKINSEILLIVEGCYKDILMSQNAIFTQIKKLRNIYLYIENNSMSQYKDSVYQCFNTFKNFFNQFEQAEDIIKTIDILTGVVNNKLHFIIGGVKALCNIANIIEWIYAVITSANKNKNEAILLSIGCKKLKLDKYSFCKYISKDINRCRKVLKPKSICRTIIEDILPLRKYLNLRSVSLKNTHIKEFREYFIIADYAYKDIAIYKNNKLSQKKWTSPKVKYRINNYKFRFNSMVYGIVLENHNDEVVVGFGGTEISRPLTFMIDASQIANVSPGYVYAVGLIEHIRNCTPGKNIVVCGHSLGGGLAQFATATQDDRVKAYCYNSAGLFEASYQKIKDFEPFSSNIYHYRLEWDYISCFGKLIGSVYTAKATRLICFNHGRKAIKESLGL